MNVPLVDPSHAPACTVTDLSGAGTEVLDLLATVTQERCARSSASALVDDLAVRLRCDRVTLGWVRRSRVRAFSTSHSPMLDRRQAFIADVEGAMDEALDLRRVIQWPETESDPGSLRLLRGHSGLLRAAGASWVCSIPVSDGSRIYGVLTLESSSSRLPESDLLFCEAVLRLVGPLLHLRYQDEEWLGSKALASVQRWRRRAFPRGKDGRRALAVVVVGAALLLCVGRGEHRIAGQALLEGSRQRAAVAPFDGYVSSAPARAGDIVGQGEMLCLLDPREYELEYERWSTEHDKLAKQKRQALAQMDAAEVRVISAQMQEAAAHRALVEYQLARTEIVAPIAGVVVSGDLSQSLGAPVQRGDVLFEIAPLDSYRIVLEIDERDIGPVSPGQGGQVVLSALPSETLPITIESVTPISTAREGRNYFRVEARFDSPPEARLRPGMRGVAKISVGRRSYLWLLTHDLVDWTRLQLWGWLP